MTIKEYFDNLPIGILREENSMKYIRVDWPESQEWLENDACWQSEGCWGPSVFVPEDLYDRLKGE